MRQHVVLDGRLIAYLDSLGRLTARDTPDGCATQGPLGSVATQHSRGSGAAQAPSGKRAAQDFSPANTVLLLHAFPLNADMWRPQLNEVPPGWRFLAPDLRGFGESPIALQGDAAAARGESRAAQGFSPANGSLDHYAADILALLDHLRVPDAVVVGLSMGGYLAMALCRLAAPRVGGLVLANTKAEADTSEGRRAREQMMTRVAQVGVAGLADEMLPRLLGETTRRERPDVVERVRAMAASNGVEGVQQAMAAMMHRPDSTRLLARLGCPALVVASDEDVITPPDQARAMHRALSSSDLVVIPSAGHLSNLERPDAFNEALHRFLATTANGRRA